MQPDDTRTFRCGNCTFRIRGVCTVGAQRGLEVSPYDWCRRWAPRLDPATVWETWSSARIADRIANDRPPPRPASHRSSHARHH